MGFSRSCQRVAGLIVAGLFLGTQAVSATAEEVVVYSARIEALIKPMFDAFTQKTGVKVKYFTASEKELFERLKAEGSRTPADLLMTVDAGNLWIAEQFNHLLRQMTLCLQWKFLYSELLARSEGA